jgi:hypothetical protein
MRRPQAHDMQAMKRIVAVIIVLVVAGAFPAGVGGA